MQTAKNNAVINWMPHYIARAPEVGARALVFGASSSEETHGLFVPDCKISPVYGMGWGEQGLALQERFWRELKEKLEAIRTGVTEV